MKNTLAENMLRFAPKNLKASNIKTLKRLAEQQAAKQMFAPLSEQPSFNPATPNQILKGKEADIKWLFVPYGTTVVTMPNNTAIASGPVMTGGRLIACPTPFKVSNTPQIEGKAVAAWATLYYTELPYDVLDVSTASPEDVADQKQKGSSKDQVPFALTLFSKIQPTVDQLLISIGELLRKNKVNTNDTSTRKAVADFIIGIQNNGIALLTDFPNRKDSLTKNTFKL
jgi:hypothetical protein